MLISEVNDSTPVRKLNTAQIKLSPTLLHLLRIFEEYGFKTRIIGGAVRDVMLGRRPRDIDLATTALPDQIMYILQQHNVSFGVKGLPHGTIKIKCSEHEEYEITSLAFQINPECCPPQLKVKGGGDWKEDAIRRDFTVDTLSMSVDGHLYDPLGSGLQDLRSQTVKFIGDPAERIKKDPVLILRFFKLLSLFKNPKFEKSVLPIIQSNMKLVKKLKPKRIENEVTNIANSPNAEKVRRMMTCLGFDEIVKEKKSYAAK